MSCDGHELLSSGASAQPAPQQAGVKRKRPGDEGYVPEPGTVLRLALCDCNKTGDLERAFGLYDAHIMAGLTPSGHVYSLLLNIASKATRVPPTVVRDAVKVFTDMRERGLPLSEAAYSSLVRICAVGGDLDRARALLVDMVASDVHPRLRTYAPVIAALAARGDAKGVQAMIDEVKGRALPITQLEHAALLRAYAYSGDATGALERVAELAASEQLIDEALEEELKSFFGGGPRGGEGAGAGARLHSPADWPWRVSHGSVDPETSVCSVTRRTLRSIDIGAEDRAVLMTQCSDLVGGMDGLALGAAGRRAAWASFREWVSKHGPFDVVVDGANIGYANQNFAEGALSYSQIDAVVREFQDAGKRVLLVLHSRWLEPFTLRNEGSRRALRTRINHYAIRQRADGLMDAAGARLARGSAGVREASTLAGAGGGAQPPQEKKSKIEGATGGGAMRPPPPARAATGKGATAASTFSQAPRLPTAPPAVSPAQVWRPQSAVASQASGSEDSYESAEERGEFGGGGSDGGEEEEGEGPRDDGGNPHIASTPEEDTRMAPGIVARWDAEGIIFRVPKGFNDDWYWLYAALACQERLSDGAEGGSSAPAIPRLPVHLVSNDLMRDHHFQLLHARALLMWRDRHQVFYHFRTWRDAAGRRLYRLSFRFPQPHSHVVQLADDGRSWHFPLTAPIVEGPGVTPIAAAKAHNRWLVAWREGAAQGSMA